MEIFVPKMEHGWGKEVYVSLDFHYILIQLLRLAKMSMDFE